MPQNKNVMLVGHLTRDRLVLPGEPERVLPGGCVTYAAPVYCALGWKTSVVTAGGPIDALPADITVHRQPSETTTTFVNRYTGQTRHQEIEAIAPTLVPPSSASGHVDLLHLAPVLGEVTLSDWRGRARFVGLGLQGWLRRSEAAPGPGVSVVAGSPPVLNDVDAVALSEDDLRGHAGLLDTLRRRVPFVALTRGEHGATIFAHGRVGDVPAVRTQQRDPTGAGDTFAAAWFAGLAAGKDASESAHDAVRAAAACVEIIGVPSVSALASRRGP